MELKVIDVELLRKLFLAGTRNLEVNKEIINELNVFPVPDGDTGTNMTMTIMSAANEVNKLVNPSLAELCKAISSGSLRGARGNSGVILSQLLRGLTKALVEFDEINVKALSVAFQRATETAYKAVMKPKEGTILTVAKGGATKALELADKTDDVIYFVTEVVKYMEEVLAYTPELLPVLKEAGVVDSGGQGLVEILHGVLDCLNGKEFDFTSEVKTAAAQPRKATGAASDEISTADIKFGYCTEFIILLEKEFPIATEFAFKEYLESIGDSIVVVADDDIVKVHVHTNDPGLAIQRALTYGQLSKLKIDNMREEHNERVITGAEQAKQNDYVKKNQAPKKPYGFVSVSVGDGVNEIFKSLGTDVIIEGGQTMNPSTEDILKAVEQVNAENVFILPNNKNIILAATQAESLVEDKNVMVVPTKTIPQGICALIEFIADRNPEENLSEMTEALKRVKTGQVTYAVRDTSIDGIEIHQNDIMGLDDKTVKVVGSDIAETTINLLETMIDEDSEIVTVYAGEGVSEEVANQVIEMAEERFPDVEVELHDGGQPVYYFVVSVE
ncbi:MAG: DAK2 domain-containing protein [Lachnospiraceae bacterium]|nr:DAK2 domain-containing protein [Lachnospiraceae bacterium]